MIKKLLEDCLRLEKRKVRFLSVVLALSVLLNLLLSVLLGVTLSYKASEVKRQTSATASAAVVHYNNNIRCTTRRNEICHNIRTQNIRCKTYQKKNLLNLLIDLCSAKLKNQYCLIFTPKSCLCGRSAINTGIQKAVSGKFILGC